MAALAKSSGDVSTREQRTVCVALTPETRGEGDATEWATAGLIEIQEVRRRASRARGVAGCGARRARDRVSR